MKKKSYSREDVEWELFVRNNKYISKMLDDNKYFFDIYKKDHKTAFPFGETKIQIPSRTISDVIDITLKNKINELQLDDCISSNISYMFQYDDLIRFFIQNFNIYGPLENIVYHYAIINNFSIIEAITKGIVQRYRENCESCKNKGKGCQLQINAKEQENFKIALAKLEDIGFINLTDVEKRVIFKLKDIRDDVHISSKKIKFFNDSNLSCKTWRYSSAIVQKFIDCLNKTEISIFQCPNKIPQRRSK